ncbi:MAG: hypothetical protein IJO64_04295 [Clostridia bacterium]|nr:hypothetical protein [Clostridia bacterium]
MINPFKHKKYTEKYNGAYDIMFGGKGGKLGGEHPFIHLQCPKNKLFSSFACGKPCGESGKPIKIIT